MKPSARRRVPSVTACLAVFNALAVAASAQPADFLRGELVMKLKEALPSYAPALSGGAPETGLESFDRLGRDLGLLSLERLFSGARRTEEERRLFRKLGLDRYYRLRFEDSDDPIAISSIYEADESVEAAHPIAIGFADAVPNDPLFSEQYGLNNTGQSGGTVDADLDAPESWDDERGNRNVVVAIVDSGVDLNHPDLAANMWRNLPEGSTPNGVDDDGNGFVDDIDGWDFVNGDRLPQDDQRSGGLPFGHGTMVAGIAGARGNNNRGVAGVCWSLRLMPVKVLNAGNSGSCDDIAEGVVYAAENGADIINLSVRCDSDWPALRDAIAYAHGLGCVIVASAGNQSTTVPQYPAAYDVVIAVGATDRNDALWAGSNRGTWVDVVAPGVEIRSTGWDDAYRTGTGTSFAAPFVSGVAALALGRSPSLKNEDVRLVVQSSCDDLGAPGFDATFGHGRVNAREAVDRTPRLAHWFSPELVVDSEGGREFELARVAAAGSTVHVAYREDSAIYYMRSLDGGVSWDDGRGNAGMRRNIANMSNNVSQGLNIAASGNAVHVVFHDSPAGTTETYHLRSTDNGATWSAPAMRSANDGATSGNPDVAASGARVDIVWSDGYRRSNDNGANFGAIDGTIRRADAVAIDGGIAHVVYHDGLGGLFHTQNAGAGWSVGARLDPDDAIGFADIAASAGRVHVAYGKRTDLMLEVFVARRSGGVWGSGVRLTNHSAGFDALEPNIGAEGDRVDIVWWDDRDGFFRRSIQHAASFDGGATYGPLRALSSYGYDTNSSVKPSVSVANGTAYVAWEKTIGFTGRREISFNRDPGGVSVTLAPSGETYARGERLTFDVTLSNHTGADRTVDVWAQVLRPGSRRVLPKNPRFMLAGVVVAAGETRVIRLDPRLKPALPLGSWHLGAWTAEFETPLHDLDSFAFTLTN